MKAFLSLTLLLISLVLLFKYLWRDQLQSILPEFEAYATAQQKAWNVQGMAIGIIKEDRIILMKGYGQRGLDDRQPVDENTLFQIGSLSKAFTAALTAIGVEKEWLKWDDKVIAHMPEFHLEDSWVTAQFEIQDLLSQRSGLPPYAGDWQSLLGYSTGEMIQNLRFLRTSSSFRSQYAYQNIFFLLAGHILEKKSNSDYPTMLKREIFTPLEMTASSATLEDYIANRNRAELLIHAKDGSVSRLKEDLPEANSNYIHGPAGGINSTIKDMSNWMIFQVNQGKFKDHQLISAEQMKRLNRAMIFIGTSDEGTTSYYAMGWVRTDYSPYPILWHNGSTMGTYNAAAFIPEEKLGIVVLTNGKNTVLASSLAFQFFDMYYNKPDKNWSQKLLTKSKEAAKKTAPKAENPSSPMPLVNYTGEYQNPIYGKTVVKEVDHELHLILGKNQKDFLLKPWDRDIFTTSWAPLEEEEIKVMFLMDETGKVGYMHIDALADEGSGEFDKILKEESEKAKT